MIDPAGAQAVVLSSTAGRLAGPDGKPSLEPRQVDRYDLAGGKALGRFEVASISTPIAVAPGGTRVLLAEAGVPDRVDVVAADGGKPVAGWRPFESAKGPGREVAWADFLDAGRVLTASKDGTLALWSIPDCKALYVAEHAFEGVPVLRPDRKVLAGLREGVLRLIDPATGSPIGDGSATGRRDARGLEVAGFDPEGHEFAALLDGTIVRWDLRTGEVLGELPSPVPKAVTLEYGGKGHVLLDGRALLDLRGGKVVWNYVGGVPARGGSGLRHSYVASEGFIGQGKLTTIDVPEAKVVRDEAAAADARVKALIRPESKVGIQVVGAPGRDPEKFRRELTAALAERLTKAGVVVADNQPVNLVATFREVDKGESLRLMGQGQTRSMAIRDLDWELSVADGKGKPVVLARDKTSMRGGMFQNVPQGDNDWEGYIRAGQWYDGSKALVERGVPGFVARRPDGDVILPGRSFLGYP